MNNIIKNSRDLFKGQPEFAHEIEERLRRTLHAHRGKDSQVIAELLLDEMGRLDFGGKLNQRWKRLLKISYSPGRAAKALASQARRVAGREAMEAPDFSSKKR